MSVQFVDMVDATSKSHQASQVNFPVVPRDATTVPFSTFTIRVAVPASASAISIAAPCALEVIDAYASVITDGGAETVTVKNGADAVSTAMDIHIAAGLLVRTLTIDTTKNKFAAGATITVAPSAATGVAIVYITCISQ